MALKITSAIKYENLEAHKLAAFHWRYDLEDWADERKNPKMKDKLQAIRNNPKVLVDFIENALEDRNITRIVMFSPPNDFAFLEDLRRRLTRTEIYTEKEIVELVKSELDEIDIDSEKTDDFEESYPKIGEK